jgi:flagellar biosynthesis protein FlhA
VVTNGAARVAEVGARFTLDAMPGKQMAIDADLNAGQITEDQARVRREDIAREADFYGAMDGASKFVKGDAMAAVLITAINLIGGIVIGVVQQGRPLSEAVQHFSLLSVGDGLAAQIPRCSSRSPPASSSPARPQDDLGTDVSREITSQRKARSSGGAVIASFALVPGLPKIPFLVIGGIFFLAGRAITNVLAEREATQAQEAATAALPAPATPRDQALEALSIDPVELSIGFGLVPLVDGGTGGSLLARVGAVRRQVAADLGAVIPPVRIHDDVALGSHEYVMKVRGNEVARGSIMAGHQLALDPGDAVGQLAGIPTTEPAYGLPAVWIPDPARAEAEALGYTVVDAESVIVTHLTETIRPTWPISHATGCSRAARQAQGIQRGCR